MNILDIIILIALTFSFFLGWKLRAIHLLGMILSLAVGIWAANHYHHYWLGLFKSLSPPLGQAAAWFLTFLAAAIVVSIGVTLLAKTFDLIRLQWLDRLLGAAMSMLFTLGLLSILLVMTNILAQANHWTLVDKSLFAKPLLNITRPLLQKKLHQYPSTRQVVL